MPPLAASVITETSQLEALYEPWQRLAHACSCPAALPGWQLAWWRHLAPAGARLRAVAIYDREKLVGLAPFFANPGRRVDFRLIGGGMTHRVSPLASPGLEREVAEMLASTLAACEPAPDLVAFEAVDASSPWPEAVREAWPGRFKPWRYNSSRLCALVADFDGETFDSWFASRSKKFREEMRRARREVERAGGTISLPETGAEAERFVQEFVRLHLQRRAERGGSSLSESWGSMLSDAAKHLVPSGEMRLWTLEVDGHVVAVNVTLAAGGVLSGFNTGFDETFGRLKPGHLTTLAAIEDAFERGETRLDTGGGDVDYKRRLASRELPIMWTGLVPRTRRYALTRLRLAPSQAHWLAQRSARKLPPSWRRRIKRLLRRPRGRPHRA